MPTIKTTNTPSQSFIPFSIRILPSALFSYLLLGLAKTQELAVEVPTKENFLRREGHAVAVMGNYLYIEGGEISQIVNGSDQPPPPLTYPYPVNKTLAIALNKSWRTDTVTFETIDKGSHSTVRGNVLWSHPDGKRLYSWGGTAPFEIPNTDSITPRLRVFTKDGGPGPGGKWEYSGVPPLSREPYILRTDFGTGASCNGVGLYMSGAGNRGSDSGIATKYGNSSGPFAVQGLVTYNMNSQGWTNESLSRDGDPAFGPRSRPNQHDGAAVCLPDNVGTRGGGLAFFLGGWQPNKVGTTDPQRITFREVFFYDVAAQRAYKQVTSGEPPDSGVGVCAVVAGGKKASPSSYEIFLVVPEARDPGAVYILTVPGFHWFKVPYEGATRDLNRERHRCAVDNRGGRQMIALGGRASTPQTVPHWLQKDPWINGLKVLDLTSLRWGDEYNADAPPYEVPDMVKEWYAKEYKGLDSIRWSGDGSMKALFSSMPVPPQTQSQVPQQPGDAVPVGAIVGGVVGGVAALAAAGALAWFCLRRKKQRQQQQQYQGQPATDTSTHEQIAMLRTNSQGQWPKTQGAGGTPLELPDGEIPYSGHAHEVASPPALHELPASQR
ncbi:hypothetical protein RB600_009310 [Gaeumannomyces tritici]